MAWEQRAVAGIGAGSAAVAVAAGEEAAGEPSGEGALSAAAAVGAEVVAELAAAEQGNPGLHWHNRPGCTCDVLESEDHRHTVLLEHKDPAVPSHIQYDSARQPWLQKLQRQQKGRKARGLGDPAVEETSGWHT